MRGRGGWGRLCDFRLLNSLGNYLKDIRFLLKPTYTDSRALIIGINKYISVSPLEYAVNDAVEVKQILIDELKFSPENIIILLDEEATRNNILKAFHNFTQDHVNLDERIIIYYAGHGHTVTGFRGDVGYLVPYDGTVNETSSLIRWDEFTRNAELIRAKHMLFIMDACYGGLALTRSPSAGSARFLDDMMLRYSRQVLTAGKGDEVVSDGGSPLPEHSIFTGHLINGLKGEAATANGVITAAGLMSYVYSKVSNDKNSDQTPHYGYFDGDGDLILKKPELSIDINDAGKDNSDRLIIIPFPEVIINEDGLKNKIKHVKTLLSDQKSSIQLHDFFVNEIRKFVGKNLDDYYPLQTQYSDNELQSRIEKYQTSINNLAILSACMAYWGSVTNLQIMQKIIVRSTDGFDANNGLVVWLKLRWYPMTYFLYMVGISAIASKRYDSLATLFYSNLASQDTYSKQNCFALSVSTAMLELQRMDIFKKLPGHERHYAPMSEHFYKILQPALDDLLYLGNSYQQYFNEFEVFWGLVIADLNTQAGHGNWGPIGRFGYLSRHGDNSPLRKLISEAKTSGVNWAPLQAGFFGGDLDRFIKVSETFDRSVSGMNWF